MSGVEVRGLEVSGMTREAPRKLKMECFTLTLEWEGSPFSSASSSSPLMDSRSQSSSHLRPNEAALGSSVLLLGAQDLMWKQQNPKVGLEGGFPVVSGAPLVPGTCQIVNNYVLEQ